MSNYLLRLAARSLGILDVVSFRTPSLFEPQPQFQPPLQNGSMIRESMIKSTPLPEDEISEGRSAESQVAGDLTIHSPRIRKSAFSFRPDKFEEASHAVSAGVPPSRQKQCSPHIIPGIFAPNSSGRHSQNPAQGDEYGKDGYSRESREGKYGKEGSETLLKAGFQIDPDDRLLSMSEKAHLPPNRSDAPPYRSNRSPVADPSLNERDSPNENEPLDRNQSRHEISYRGNPGQTDGNPVPDSGPNSSSSTIQPMQRMDEEKSLESHRIGSFKDSDLSAPNDRRSTSGFPGIESSLPVKRPWKGDDGNYAKEGRAQEDLASRLSETGARKKIESPAVIAEAAVREDAPKQNDTSRDYCIPKISNLQENHGEQLKAFLSDAPVPSQNADLGISDQKHLMPAEAKRPPIDKFHAEETFPDKMNPGLHRQRALFRRSPKALQFRSAAERGSGIIGHGSYGKDHGITDPYRSAATGNALQFSTAHLSAELYLEKQEVEQRDDGLIPAGLPAPSSSSNPKPSDILKNIQHAEGNSGIIRPGLASEPGGDNPMTIAPSIGKFVAFKGAPPAKKDIFAGGTFAYPTILKMQAALGGCQIDEAPQVPANQISAPQVSKSQHIASIRDDASISASSQDPDARESPPPALLLNVSPHNASSIILKQPHVSPVQRSGSRTAPSLFSSPDVLSKGVFDLIESNEKRHYIRARLLSPGAKHPSKEAINPGLYEKISHFSQAEAGVRRALSKKKVAPLQNSAPANSAFEDIALPADRSFSGSVRLAEPGRTPKIGDSHAASDEIRKIREGRKSLDRLNRLQNVERERKMFGVRADASISARKDTFAGETLAYPTILKMHTASIRDDASIAASSQDPDARASPPHALLLNVSPHNASSIILKQPHVSPVQRSGSRTAPSLFSSPDVLSKGVFDLIESNEKRHYIRARLLSPSAKHPPKEGINPGIYEKISHFSHAEAGVRRALSKKKVAPLQNSAPANSAFEDIALPADRSFSGSVRLAEPGRTPKIGDSHAVSDEIRKIRESRRSRDRLERLQNVEREREMFGVRADSGREGRIKVIIGRIDVRADIAPESKETGQGAIPASRSSPRLTLDGYLKQRNEGRI